MVKPLPETESALLLRTDFSDDAAWESIGAAIRAPVGEFRAYVEDVNDPVFDGLELGALLALSPPTANRSFIFIVDRMTIAHPEHPILVVDLHAERGRTFRVIPSEMWGVE